MSWVQVTEDKIIQTIEMIDDEERASVRTAGLRNALDRGGVFIENGLTPFYIFNDELGAVFVTSEEVMDKKFH